MLQRKIVRHILIPAAVVVAEEKFTEHPSEVEGEKNPQKCRPSELPIYTKQQEQQQQQQDDEQKQSIAPKQLIETIRTSRVFLTKAYNEAAAYQRVASKYLHESFDQAEWLIKYLRQEDNTMPKAGAIFIGSLTGYIFSLRRGRFFKRLFYTTTGGLGMAAICYPKQATNYSHTALNETKKFVTIAYNFIYGVKKDDPPLELPSLPKLPTSLNEAWSNLKTTTTNLISGQQHEQQQQQQVTSTSTNDK